MIEEGQCNLSEESLSTCRVDKKAAQQTESGSNNVSYRSMSKGSSQGSSLPSNSISTQGIQKKNGKTKADMEIPDETLVSSKACLMPLEFHFFFVVTSGAQDIFLPQLGSDGLVSVHNGLIWESDYTNGHGHRISECSQSILQ